MKSAKIFIFLIAGLLAVIPLVTVNAEEDITQVTANITVALLVDGREIDGAVVSVPIGSNVCVGASIKYTQTNERHRFSSWEHQPTPGSTQNLAEANQALTNECIVVTEGGAYTAIYVPEVLFQVRSSVDAYKQSRWVEKGSVVELSVSELVEQNENVRYRFSGWNAGESPFTPENRVAVLGPTVLELSWNVEYNMKVEDVYGNLSPSSGWHRSNDTVLISAPEEVLKDGGREMLKFKKWEVVYGPFLKKSTNASMAVLVDGPCLLRPIYAEFFLVEAKNFQGVLFQEWVRGGEEVEIETPALVEVAPERERYLFKGWRGKEGLEGNDVGLIVESSLSLEAIYQRQFKLNVSSPYGASGEGWYTEGEQAIIMAPQEPQSMLFFKRVFDGYLGIGNGGIGNGGYGNDITLSERSVTAVQVNEPLTVTAAYRSEVNPKVLILMLGVLTVGIFAYVGTEWGPKLYRRLRRRDVEVPVISDEMKRLLG